MITYCLWYTHDQNFGSLSWFWRCKEHSCPFSPHLGFWRTLEVSDWGLASWSWFEYGHLSLKYPWPKFWLSILILRVQRAFMSLKSSFRALKDVRGSWLGFLHLDLDLDMVTGLCYTYDPNFGSLSSFWRCKEHPCPLSYHLGLWRMLEVPDWGLAPWY